MTEVDRTDLGLFFWANRGSVRVPGMPLRWMPLVSVAPTEGTPDSAPTPSAPPSPPSSPHGSQSTAPSEHFEDLQSILQEHAPDAMSGLKSDLQAPSAGSSQTDSETCPRENLSTAPEDPPEDSCPHQFIVRTIVRTNDEAPTQPPVEADKIIACASAPTDISRQVQEEIAKTGTGRPRYHGLATNNLETLLRDKAG